MINFKNSKVFTYIKNNWVDKDMEQYFIDKNIEFTLLVNQWNNKNNTK